MVHWAVAFSGFAALVYELVWQEKCRLLLGSSAVSVALITAGFFGGLALGAWLARLAMGIRQIASKPFYFFAVVELLIGLYGQTSLAAFELLEGRLGASTGSIGMRMAMAFLVITVPCVLMGLVMPVVAVAIGKVQRIYFWNTVGGAVGVFVCGFFLLGSIGLPGALAVALTANLAAAALSWKWQSVAEVGSPALKAARRESNDATKSYRYYYALSAFIGFTTLGLEVLWTRNLVLVIGTTTYAFTHILCAFLIVTALSTAYLPRFVEKNTHLIFVLSALFLGISQIYFQWFPDLFVSLGQLTRSFYVVEFFRFITVLMVLGPVIFMLSGLFPRLSEACLAKGGRLESFWGYNLAFSGLGALVVGFWAIPSLGTPNIIRLIAIAYFLLGVGYAVRGAGMPHKRFIGLAAAALLLVFLPRWDWSRLDRATYLYLSDHHPGEQVFYEEDLQDNVSVVKSGPTYTMKINGKFQANTTGERSFQSRLMHIPMLFSANPENVLTIGLGGGETAGTALLYPEVKRLDVVEISSAVIRASKQFFAPVQHGLFTDTRTAIIHDDARTHLKVTDRKYDVVSIEGSIIWSKGQTSLWNKEFYELVASRLTPSGVMGQWIHIHHVSWENIKVALSTIRTVFPYVEVFRLPGLGSMVVVAARQPLFIDLDTLAKRSRDEKLRQDSRVSGLHGYYEYLAERAFGGATVDQLVSGVVPSSDYFPLLEFSTPLSSLQEHHTFINSLLIDKLSESSGLPPLSLTKSSRGILDFFVALSHFKQGRLAAAALHLEWLLKGGEWSARESAWTKFGSSLNLRAIARYYLANAYSKMNQHDRALESYVALEPYAKGQAYYHYSIGRLREFRGENSKARESFLAGLKLAEAHEKDEGILHMMRSLLQEGRFTEAKAFYEQNKSKIVVPANRELVEENLDHAEKKVSTLNAPAAVGD